MNINLYPLNDFDVVFGPLKRTNVVTGRPENITEGDVVAFLALSSLPTATPADPTLEVDCTYLGTGKWLAHFDATVLTVELLEGLFADTTPYLIVQVEGELRAFTVVRYFASRETD